MARIGVISDSHGNLEMMRSAAIELRTAYHVDLIIHLGDYYRDAMQLRDEGYTVWAVPGTMCPAYATDARILRESFGGIRIVCAHTPEDLRANAQDAGLCMHGHTHIPYAEQRGRSVWLNPGHLKSRLDRGEGPTYAVLDLEPGLIQATIHGLDGTVRVRGAFRIPMETAHA